MRRGWAYRTRWTPEQSQLSAVALALFFTLPEHNPNASFPKMSVLAGIVRVTMRWLMSLRHLQQIGENNGQPQQPQDCTTTAITG